MRIWYGFRNEEWRYLDNKRINAQLGEHLVLWNRVRSGKRWLGWENPHLLRELWRVHRDVKIELLTRGYHPNVTIPEPDYDVEQIDLNFDQKLVAKDKWTLMCRWHGQYKGRGEKPIWAASMERIYAKQGGCIHQFEVAKLTKDTELCMICKEYARYKGSNEWFKIGYNGRPL